MTIRKRLLCLLFALAVCSTVTALADAAVEEYWNYAYSVDRTIYVNASDGLGLFMRAGPGTDYSKVNDHTIPNGAAVRITQECTAENGWKWGWCSYQFPGESYENTGWICLVETTSRDPAAAAPAPSADTEARSVDRILYINTADGLGLFMRTGPGTDYSKVDSHTIPNGTALHITREITATNGWTWGWCSYQFPGKSAADSGWTCLVETTAQAPTAARPSAQEPAPVQDPAPVPQETQPEDPAPSMLEEESPSQDTDPVREAETTEAAPADEQSAPAQTEAEAENAGVYSSMSLAIIGVVIGVAAAAAILLIVTKRKR